MPQSLVSMLFILTLFLAACQGMVIPASAATPTAAPPPSPTFTRADEQVIPFTTLALNRDFPYLVRDDDEIDQLRQPQVHLVTDPKPVASFQQWLPPETLAALAQVDYVQYFVIVFFVGINGGDADGYIDRIAVDPTGAINVYGVRRQFSSGTASDTFPSHVVQIRREDVPIPVDADVPVNLATRVDRRS